MSGTIRVIDLPDLGAVTDASSFVVDKTGTGRFSALALKSYCATTTLPEAPSNNTPYGRMNGAWTPVLGDAPSNGTTYARLNATWTTVPPEAPLSGAIYGRGNAGWTPVLPISGGGIQGGLGVNGTLNVAGGTYTDTMNIGSAVGFEWAFGVQGGSQNHVMVHRGNYYDVWLPATGAREWISPAGVQMTLDSSGSLAVLGGLTGATGVWQHANSFGFAPGGQGTKFFHGASYYWEWNSTTGQMTWLSNNTPLWNMRASDAVCFNSVAAVGGVGAYINSSDRRGKTGITPTPKGLAEVLQLQPVAFSRADPMTGSHEEIGFVAQDVLPILPEAVWTAGIPLRDGSGGLDSSEPTLAISEATISAISVNAIQELHALIVTLTDRIAALEAA